MRADVAVLGAGMVGVSAALHLQQRGRSVVLIDRRAPGEETSYGNAGIIQREGIVPYPFPRDVGLLARYALNLLPEANLHYSALPSITPWLYRYWRASTPEGIARTARGARPLVERCITEHEALMARAGLLGLMRRTGYMRIYRSPGALDAALAKQQRERETYGVNFQVLDAAAVSELEPHLRSGIAGGMLMPDPVSVSDPGALVKGYASLLAADGGQVLVADVRQIEPSSGGWTVTTSTGPIAAREVVLALGPWSNDLFRPLGYRLPLGFKRGYHQHFKPAGNATLNRPVLDAEVGYVMAPMSRGVRITTGAEFALRDAPPTPVQLTRVTPRAREVFPLGETVDAQPWLGRRPCMPDMLPVIGRAPRHPGLWFDFGHHHLGFTLGPASGRLLAEMMTGGETFTDPRPYSAERFG
jgi:D-amino-acid dehydrogenase